MKCGSVSQRQYFLFTQCRFGFCCISYPNFFVLAITDWLKACVHVCSGTLKVTELKPTITLCWTHPAGKTPENNNHTHLCTSVLMRTLIGISPSLTSFLNWTDLSQMSSLSKNIQCPSCQGLKLTLVHTKIAAQGHKHRAHLEDTPVFLAVTW